MRVMNHTYLTYIAVSGVALLGLVLLLNPLYLHPDGSGEYKVTYHVEAIETEVGAEAALQQSEQVLQCPGERPCALETQILEAGSVEYDGFIDDSEEFRNDSRITNDPRWYPVVTMAGEPYVPESEYKDNKTVLTLSEISNIEAVERTAVDAAERSEEVQEAVETGSVTVYGEHSSDFEQNKIIAYDGEYYWQTRYQSQGYWLTGSGLIGVRVALFLSGSGLLAYAGWCFRAAAD